MNARTRVCLALFVLILTFAGAVYLHFLRIHNAKLPPSKAAAIALRAVAAPSALAAPKTAPKPLPPNSNEVATNRMYLAHASLRTPEVADPDSVTNREILQTMIGKALGQPAKIAPKVSSPR